MSLSTRVSRWIFQMDFPDGKCLKISGSISGLISRLISGLISGANFRANFRVNFRANFRVNFRVNFRLNLVAECQIHGKFPTEILSF